MKTTTIEVPNLYGDHHVLEIRKILQEIPGVTEVYVSSAFRTIEVTYDGKLTSDLEISVKLDEAGYLSEWNIPEEASTAGYLQENTKSFFRHTAVYETTRQVISFSQVVPTAGRPLWNCPGLGVIRKMEE